MHLLWINPLWNQSKSDNKSEEDQKLKEQECVLLNLHFYNNHAQNIFKKSLHSSCIKRLTESLAKVIRWLHTHPEPCYTRSLQQNEQLLLLILVHRHNHCQKKPKGRTLLSWFSSVTGFRLPAAQCRPRLLTNFTPETLIVQVRCENPPVKTHKTILQTKLSIRPIIPLWCQHAAQPQLFTLSTTTLSRNQQFSGLLHLGTHCKLTSSCLFIRSKKTIISVLRHLWNGCFLFFSKINKDT